MVIKSYDDFLKKYCPIKYEAEQVAEMNEEEYIAWLVHTPKEKTDKVIEELHRMADGHMKKRKNILSLLGY